MNHEPLRANDIDFHVVDADRLVRGERSTTVYPDMDHCGKPAKRNAPTDFTHSK